MLGLVVDPDFATNRRFYTCSGHTRLFQIQVIAWSINDTYPEAVRIADPLVGGIPMGEFHSGCRLRFGPEGFLWITTGDARIGTSPQDLASLGGKVLRVNPATGAGAATNPFAQAPLVYTYGHRNPQGLARRPSTSQMWSVEHGTSQNDEINLLVSGGNYGWDPDAEPGYRGRTSMTDLERFPQAIEAKWSSGYATPAASGGIFLEGSDWGEWEGRLAVATLKTRSLLLFEFTTAGTFVSEVIVPELDGTYGRLRTPMLGRGGALYLTTANGGGADRILKIVPGRPPAFAAATDTQEVTENNSTSTVVATVTATDPDGERLTYTLGGVDAGVFAIPHPTAGGLRANVQFDHEARRTYEVVVTATDPYGLSARITLTITVTDVDEPPEVLGEAHVTIEENSTDPVGRYRATDPEGAATGWTALDGPDGTYFELTDFGDLSFTAVPDFDAKADANGDNQYEVTVQAKDEGGETGTLAVTVTVTNVNEPPAISGPDSVPYAENGTGPVAIYTTTDPEDQTIIWQLTGEDQGRFVFSNGLLRFVTTPDFESPADAGGNNEYSVTVRASDGPNPVTHAVTITVTNEEEPGTLSLSSEQPQVDAVLTATLTDPDRVLSEAWSWQRSQNRSTWSEISGETGSSYTPVAADLNHYLRVMVDYTDGEADGKSLQEVLDHRTQAAPQVNSPPQFPGARTTRSVAENSGAEATVGQPVTATGSDSDSDSDSDTLTYTLTDGDRDRFTIDSSGGQIRVREGALLDFESGASYYVTVTATDPSTTSDSIFVDITVTNVNEAPEATADTGATDEDEAVAIDVLTNDTDPENDDLTVSLRNRPRNGSAAVEPDGAITYTPDPDYHGADTYTYTVSDGHLSGEGAVSVTIRSVNDAPEFARATADRSISERAQPGANVGAPVTASDRNGDVLNSQLSGSDAFAFEVDEHTGQITPRPGIVLDPATRPSYTGTVTADDRSGGTASIEVTITVEESASSTIGGGSPGGGGGGGGGPSGPSPSALDFEWTVKRDIKELDGGHDSPTGAWSDGSVLWLAENGDGADDMVYAYDLKTGERLDDREYELAKKNRAPRGFWSDGVTLWVSDSGQERLFAYDFQSGERVPERDIDLDSRNRDARGIWSDRETMWVLDGGKDSLFAYTLESGALLAEYALDDANDDPRGIWSDGVTFWVSDHGAKRLFAYRLEEGEDGQHELVRNGDEEFGELSGASNNSPRGIWSDGDIMYVADESDDKVYTYNMPDAINARLATLSLSGVDIGEFDGGTLEYTGTPTDGVTVTTVEAQALQRRTGIAFDPPDADENADGHQVALAGLGEITVTVTSADGSRTRVYRVTVELPEDEIEFTPPWTSLEWPGTDGIAMADALRAAGLSDTVIIIYHWAEAARTWLAFFPGLEGAPGLNTLTTLTTGTTYWIAVSKPIAWTMPEATGQP